MVSRNQRIQRQIDEVITRVSDEASQIDAFAKIRGWFRPAESSEYFQLIQAYLAGKIDVTQTINEITGPIDAALSKGRINDIDFQDLWYSLFHSAKRIRFRDEEGHTKLVELVHAYRTHPEPSHEGRKIYQPLEHFGICARETINDAPGCGAGFTAPEIKAWANLHNFFACLTKSNYDFDYWLYCLWVMRDALEEIQKDEESGDADTAVTAAEKYDAHVPAATVWVLALGKELYEKEEDLTPSNPKQGNPAKGGDLWKGKPEFSKARWALWKKRFEEISDMEKVSDETRNLAKEAYGVMNAAENF